MNAQLCSAPLVAGVEPMPADVASQRQAAPLPLAPGGPKAVELDCDGGRLSSAAGVVLRQDLAAPLGLTRALAAVLSDPRDARRLHFPPEDWLQPRVLHMAAGDEAANDSHTRRDAPICTLRRARLPETGAPLASPPTLARLANRSARTALSRLALGWLEQCSAS